MRKLPPLATLRAFEAAARHMSFKEAAAELGVTVPELVAELAALDTDPILVDSDEIAELDRRWKKIEEGKSTVLHERVVRWLRTWGTPRFRPWRAQ